MNERTELGAASNAASGSESSTWIDAEAFGIPWFDFEIQRRIAWRDGDVVISVPQKCGTTWMMNIVHQLRSGAAAREGCYDSRYCQTVD